MNRKIGVRSDQVVRLRHPKSYGHYPERIRRIAFRDPETDKGLVFSTNNFDLLAEGTIKGDSTARKARVCTRPEPSPTERTRPVAVELVQGQGAPA